MIFEFMRRLFRIPTAAEIAAEDRERRYKETQKYLNYTYFNDRNMDYIIIDEVARIEDDNYEAEGFKETDDVVDAWDKIADDLDIDFGYDCTSTDDTYWNDEDSD